jgi:hypothetical protein
MAGTAEIPKDILSFVTDLTPTTIQTLTLSELKEVLEEAKEMLRPFFDVLEMLGAVAGYLNGMRANSSTEPSAS